jgi:hypothetical protein
VRRGTGNLVLDLGEFKRERVVGVSKGWVLSLGAVKESLSELDVLEDKGHLIKFN